MDFSEIKMFRLVFLCAFKVFPLVFVEDILRERFSSNNSPLILQGFHRWNILQHSPDNWWKLYQKLINVYKIINEISNEIIN
jgi:hypothetical protein